MKQKRKQASRFGIYFKSQPWPFPHSLMVVFRTTHREGEGSINDSENKEDGWSTVHNLPPIPKGSASPANKSPGWLSRHAVVNHRHDEDLPRTSQSFYFNLFVMASPTSDVLDLPPMSWVFTFPSANTAFIASLTPVAASSN